MGQRTVKKRAVVSTPFAKDDIFRKKKKYIYIYIYTVWIVVLSFRTSFIISILTYISSLHVLGFSIRYPDLSKLHSLIGVIPGYGVPPEMTI